MDQVQLPQVPQPKKNNLLFLEIGAFEIGFVVVLLILIFGLLNFLGILRLPFTFLPKFGQANPTFNAVPTLVPNKTIASPVLTDFITATVAKNYQPASTSALPTKQIEHSFRTYWTINGQYFQAFYTNNSYEQTPDTLSITTYTQLSADSLSSDSAKALVGKYFAIQSLPASWQCSGTKGVKPEAKICEQFSVTASGKVGHAVFLPDVTKQNAVLVTCSIPKNSSLYTQATTCLGNNL